MDIINIWNKFNIHCSKIILFLFFCTLTTISIGQKKDYQNKVFNLPNYDDRMFHYGFTVAVNSASYKVNPSNFFVSNNDSILGINSVTTLGFTLGFIVNLHISDNFDLRLLPNVGFYNRDIEYNFPTKGKEIQKIESNVIELPLLLKYKSRRQGNFRAYLIGGIKPGIEVASNKKLSNGKENLRVQDIDFVIEYGIGIDIYNPMFKFSPEIRFAHGLPNMLIKDPNIFSKTLDRVSTHTVTLYFHFE